MRRTLLVADDYALLRHGVCEVLKDSEFEVVGEAESGPQVIPAIEKYAPDVLLLDTDMPGMDVVTCLERVLKRYPRVEVVLFAAESNGSLLRACFSRGAKGWILKTIDGASLANAIAYTLEGSVFSSYGVATDDAFARELGLTSREIQIVRCVAAGMSNKQIAESLWITVQTVKFHLTNIYRKIGVANRTGASRWAFDNRLVAA